MFYIFANFAHLLFWYVTPADCPPSPPELHTVLSGFEVNNKPSASDPRTIRLEAKFLENLCQKPQILNKSQKPADRPPREPGLSAQHLKTDFSKDF
jgi:hypothetical protein